MERPLPPLDEILQMARSNDWDKRVWKPAYWHELKKLQYAKPRAYVSAVRWALLTLLWPAGVLYFALHPGGAFEILVALTLLAALMVRVDLNRFWEALEGVRKIRETQRKIGEIWDRYYEYYGEMLDPTEGNHRRV